jgi:predicted DNA-binding ribbon-helix-helix protein
VPAPPRPSSASGGGGGHLAKRSFTLAGHRTSVALEPAFWRALEAAAARRRRSLAALVAEVDGARADPAAPLASALRVFALAVAAGAGAPPPPA